MHHSSTRVWVRNLTLVILHAIPWTRGRCHEHKVPWIKKCMNLFIFLIPLPAASYPKATGFCLNVKIFYSFLRTSRMVFFFSPTTEWCKSYLLSCKTCLQLFSPHLILMRMLHNSLKNNERLTVGELQQCRSWLFWAIGQRENFSGWVQIGFVTTNTHTHTHRNNKTTLCNISKAVTQCMCPWGYPTLL